MGKLIKALKNLGTKLNGSEPDGKYVSDVIDNVANDFANGTTATKEYVNTLMSGALKRLIVEELPTTDIDTNTIYMVLDETATQGNVYNEYLYINEAWELIGTTAMEMPHLYRHRLDFSGSSVFGNSDLKKIVLQVDLPIATQLTLQTIADNIPRYTAFIVVDQTISNGVITEVEKGNGQMMEYRGIETLNGVVTYVGASGNYTINTTFTDTVTQLF